MTSFRVKYVFKGKAPKLFTAIGVLGVVNFVALMILGETRKLWEAPSSPFGEQVREALSWYDAQGMTLHFAFVAAGFVVAFLYRDRLERVPPAPSMGERPASLFDIVIAATVAPAACGFVGGFTSGAIYSHADRVWGLGIAALAVLAAVWATDRLIFSFPQSERFRKRRTAIWIWAAIVSALALVFVLSDFFNW